MLEKIDTPRMAGHRMLTPAQLRAARALVGWTREDLAAESDVFANTIRNFEQGISDPKQGTILKWRRALETAGVEFQDEDQTKGAGVRMRYPSGKGKR
jgi:transcriptional regulator with XRE-family HTH domain